MEKGEPVNELNLLSTPQFGGSKIIEAENPDDTSSGGVNIRELPNSNIINGVKFPRSSLLNNNKNAINNNMQPEPEYNIPEEQKIPVIHGEKTIICWNCCSVLMVKDEWSVVRCTNCGKINHVPGTEDNIDGAIRLNDNMNHFDLYVPYVYAVITCPFCQAENKVRKDAEHVVCFQCHNSYNIQHEPWENMVATKNNKEYPIVQQPTVVNTCDNSGNEETQRLLKKLIKQLKSQEEKPKKPVLFIPKNYDSYKPIRELVRDVDDIGDRRYNAYGKRNTSDIDLFENRPKISGGGASAPYLYMDKELSEITKKISNINIGREGENNILNPKSNSGDMEMEQLKKKLYDEIRNNPRYKNTYGNAGGGMRFGYGSLPPTFVPGPERKKTPYYSDKPKNDSVYKQMFNSKEELKKSYEIASDNNDIESLVIEPKKSIDTSKLPLGKHLKTKEEVNEILKNLNIDFKI